MLALATPAQVAGIRPAQAEIADRALVAQAVHGIGELPVGRDKMLEIFLGDLDQFGRLGCAHGGGTHAAADQRHFAEGMAFAQPRNRACLALRGFLAAGEHLHLSFCHDVERIARIAGMEQRFAAFELAGADIGQNGFDFFRRQMPQQVAFRQQLDERARFVLLALERIFAEARRIAHRGAFALEIDGGAVIHGGAEREAAADKGPGRAGAEGVMMQVLRALIGEFDGERADQRAGRKGKNVRRARVSTTERKVRARRREMKTRWSPGQAWPRPKFPPKRSFTPTFLYVRMGKALPQQCLATRVPVRIHEFHKCWPLIL